MADLTDSYCERCGTRYAFTESAPRSFSLKGARVLAKGLRNFVLTDGQSMADALENARLETNTENSSRVTEAFHATFNFCMVCRQYACSKCWNVRVGQCLTCAPETNVRSVSPQDHLIVRTPVARWDGDWEITPDGPVIEALLGQDSPAPTKPQGIGSHPPDAPDASQASWPAGDLLEQQMAEIVRRRSTRVTHQNKQAEADVGTLWTAGNMTEAAVQPDDPAARPPAPNVPAASSPAAPAGSAPAPDPDMTLTPQELMLIKAELSPNDQFAPPTFVDRRETPSPREVAAQWLAIRQAGSAPAPEPATLEPEVPMEPARPVRPVPPAPTPLPSLASSHAQTIEPSTRDHAPIVGKTLGRRGDHAAAKPHGRRGGSGAGSVAKSWPLATPWAARPLTAHDQWAQSQAEQAPEIPLLAKPHVRTVTVSAPVPAAPAPQAATARHPMTDLIGAELIGAELVGAELVGAAGTGMRAEHAKLDELSPADTADSNDARGAAAVRLLAVTHSRQPRSAAADAGRPSRAASLNPSTAQLAPEPMPAERPPVLSRPPEERPEQTDGADAAIPSWPAADTEVAIAVSRRIGAISSGAPSPAGPAQRPPRAAQATAAIPAPSPQPAHPWPPLGASYSPRRADEVPWSAPDPRFTAALAAQQIQPPILAEMWAQSAEEVINRGTVRVCHRCSLPVSTQARFCRRCGSPQQ